MGFRAVFVQGVTLFALFSSKVSHFSSKVSHQTNRLIITTAYLSPLSKVSHLFLFYLSRHTSLEGVVVCHFDCYYLVKQGLVFGVKLQRPNPAPALFL